MAQHPFFVDNTTLVSFALVGHLQLLPTILNGKGVVSATVEGEASRHASFCQSDARLQVLATVGQLFAIIVPGQGELAHTQNLRRLLAEPGDPRHRHLGEAESLAIIEMRHASKAVLVTDDADATRLALSRGHRRPVTTLGLLKVAFNTQVLTDQQLSDALDILRVEKRNAPPSLGGLTGVRNWAKT